MATMLLVAALLLAVVDWTAVDRGWTRVEEVAKPLVPLLLITWVLAAGDPGATRTWVVVALTLGLVGDVLLLPRVDRFVAGLAAFLLGHLAYVPALVPEASVTATAAAAVLLGIPAVVAGRRIVAGARVRGGAALARAVQAYVTAVLVTAALAVGTGIPAVAAGGTAFALSDGVLGWDRFVARIPHGRTLVHITYHLAQAGLASVALLQTVQ